VRLPETGTEDVDLQESKALHQSHTVPLQAGHVRAVCRCRDLCSSSARHHGDGLALGGRGRGPPSVSVS
jgi:hypothetical protein